VLIVRISEYRGGGHTQLVPNSLRRISPELMCGDGSDSQAVRMCKSDKSRRAARDKLHSLLVRSRV
jgi:hypothetical protein